MQINDRYEFPDELDLDQEDGKWLSENADRNVRNLYKLHSVLVHSGGVHGGHYYAYIQPDRKRWLKFDDERVMPQFIFLVHCILHGAPSAQDAQWGRAQQPLCIHSARWQASAG